MSLESFGLAASPVSRRAVLGGGLLLAATPLLASCAPASTRSTASGPLQMLMWDSYPDEARANIEAFTKKSGYEVDLQVLPGGDAYGPALQTRLQGNDRIDIYYNKSYNLTKYADAGWAQDLSNLDGVDEMLGEMFPSATSRYQIADGRVAAAPYFTAVTLLHYNKRHMTENGFTAPPESLDEVYTQSETFKKAGVEMPYAAFWIKSFCEEYLMTYLLSEGITPFDEKANPVFGDDSKTKEMLEWWAAMYQDGLTSPTILTDDPNSLAVAMQNGTSSFLMLHHYFQKVIRDAAGPESENVELSYRVPGSANMTLQLGEVLQVGTAGVDTQGAWELMKFYGWKDEAGKYATFVSWAKSAALLGPYPGLFEDPDFRAGLDPYYDVDALSEVHNSQSDPVPARSLAWYPTFQTKVGDRIHALLLGQASAADTVAAMSADAQDAIKQNG